MHSTCRAFDPAPVPEATIRVVLAAALSAPSKSDLQQTTILRLGDPGRRARVMELLPRPEYDWVEGAAEVLVVCGDNRRIRLAAADRNRPFPNRSLDQFMNAAVDAGIVLGAAVTAAEAMGLGTCPLSELRDRAGDLIEALGLSEGVFPLAGLAIGWPAERHRPITQRLPFPVSVQDDSYSDEPYRTHAEQYETERDRRERRPDDAQRDVERFGVARPYGWAEDRTRQYADPVRSDWSDHVRRQGFDLS